MKNYIFNKLQAMIFTVTALCLLSVSVVFAQTDPSLPAIINPDSSLADLLQWTDLLYAGIVIASGYLSAYIPIVKNISSTAWRVAAIALIVGAVFILMGASKGFGVLFGYLAATGFYDLILSFIKKTPQPQKKTMNAAVQPPSNLTYR